MSIRLIFNSIISSAYSLFARLTQLSFVSTYVYDWKHYPNYAIELDTYTDITAQLYVEDIQLGVKYVKNENGAALAYIDVNDDMDLTGFVAHVTWEGNIFVWGPDNDPDGIFCIVIPFNSYITNLTNNGLALTVEPVNSAAPIFASTNVRWNFIQAPNHWSFLTPRVDMDVKYNRSDNYPYVDTTYFALNISRYDDKRYEPEIVVGRGGNHLTSFRTYSEPQVSNAEFDAQMDKAAWLLSVIKHKYNHEPNTLDAFRKSAIL